MIKEVIVCDLCGREFLPDHTTDLKDDRLPVKAAKTGVIVIEDGYVNAISDGDTFPAKIDGHFCNYVCLVEYSKKRIAKVIQEIEDFAAKEEQD